METKGISCKIPVELHHWISEEIRTDGSTMSRFIEKIFEHYYETKEKGNQVMSKTRTMAFQVDEELFQRIKEYLAEYERVYGCRLTQKEFVIGLVEQALEESREDFRMARLARGMEESLEDEPDQNEESMNEAEKDAAGEGPEETADGEEEMPGSDRDEDEAEPEDAEDSEGADPEPAE